MFVSLHAWFRQREPSQPAPARRAAPGIEVLEDRCVPAVFTYHGGPLLSHVEVQPVFYGSRWSQAAYASQAGYVEGFLNTVVQDPYLETLTTAGYGVGPGSASPGVRLRIVSSPQSRRAVRNSLLLQNLGRHDAVTDRLIQQALQGAILNGRLQTPDANRLYVVYVQPHTMVLLNNFFLSPGDFSVYHAAFRGKTRGGHRVTINYAVVPYPGPDDNLIPETGGFLVESPNPGADGNLPGLMTLDTLTALTSRALVDAVTDPGGRGGSVGSGWYSGNPMGSFSFNSADNSYDSAAEIGDLLADSVVRLDGYAVLRVPDQNGHPLTPAGATSP